jgi:hypothetical protein
MQNDYKQDRDSEPDRRHSEGDKRQECKINMTPHLLRPTMRAVSTPLFPDPAGPLSACRRLLRPVVLHHNFVVLRIDGAVELFILESFLLEGVDSGSLLFSMYTWDTADSCHFLQRHRRVQSNYASRKPAGSGLVNYPPGRSDNQPAPLGRIVVFPMPMARLTTCAGKRQ